MLVKELIDKLQEYPQDIPVAINYDLEFDDNTFHIMKEFPKGDPANPKCKYIDEVLIIGW